MAVRNASFVPVSTLHNLLDVRCRVHNYSFKQIIRNRPVLLVAATVGITAPVVIWTYYQGSDAIRAPEGYPLDPTKTLCIHVHMQDPRHAAGYGSYRGQLIPLMRLTNGEVIPPVVQINWARRGFMDRVYCEKRRQAALLGVGDDAYVTLPDDDRVAEFVFLLRSLTEATGWRYYVLKRSELTGSRAECAELTLPDLLTLESLLSHSDSAQLWKLYGQAAQECGEQLESIEDSTSTRDS